MDSNLLLLIMALVLSCFFSSSETVFIAFDKLKLFIWKKNKDVYAKTLGVFFPRQERFIITTLVGVNIANVTFSSIAVIYLVSMGVPPSMVVVISTAILLIFAEILPKAVALRKATLIVRPFSVVLWIFYLILYPLIFVLTIIMKLFLRGSILKSKLGITRWGLKRVILSEGASLETEDAEIAAGVLEVAEKKMREVMTPRMEIAAAPVNSSVSILRDLIIESGHTKILLYEGDIEDIQGYIHALDLLGESIKIEEIIRNVEFVSEFMPVLKGFEILRRKETGILVVLDEYGGVDGIVTIEDLTEELVGEIEDEYDRARFNYKHLRDGYLLVSGRAEIDLLKRELGWRIKKREGIETFGGWVVTEIGRIPAIGESIDIKGFSIDVFSADEKRIKILKVKKIED